MTAVKEKITTSDNKEIMPKEKIEKSEEDSEEKKESIWDYFGRFPYVPLLFH